MVEEAHPDSAQLAIGQRSYTKYQECQNRGKNVQRRLVVGMGRQVPDSRTPTKTL